MKVKGSIPVGIDILKGPLSLKALKARAISGRIDVNIVVSLGDLIGYDINSLNDLADERILDLNTVVGSLSDINYCVVGHVPENKGPGYLCGSIILNVNADVSIINEEKS
jgi:hypothetical protein